jgi:hypothetical protein
MTGSGQEVPDNTIQDTARLAGRAGTGLIAEGKGEQRVMLG